MKQIFRVVKLIVKIKMHLYVMSSLNHLFKYSTCMHTFKKKKTLLFRNKKNINQIFGTFNVKFKI